MSRQLEFLYPLMWTFFCVLARIGPLLAMMPPIRGNTIPMQVRAFIAIAIAATITPLALSHSTPLPNALPIIAIQVSKELILGMMLGGIVMLALLALQIGAHVLASLASMESAEASDPLTEESGSVIGQFYSLLAMAIFIGIGGHRTMIESCVETFQVYPAGGVLLDESWLMHTHRMLYHAASLGLRASAPAAIALFLANLTTALLGRTLPQLNIMAIGFNINVLVLLCVMLTSIGAAGWLFHSEIANWIEEGHEAIFANSPVSDGTSSLPVDDAF